jgi:hypothetical protein
MFNPNSQRPSEVKIFKIYFLTNRKKFIFFNIEILVLGLKLFENNVLM